MKLEISENVKIQTVWKLELTVAQKVFVKNITLDEIKITDGFFKTEPFLTNKGLGYMKKTRKEALSFLVSYIRNAKVKCADLTKFKNIILDEYQELLIWHSQ